MKSKDRIQTSAASWLGALLLAHLAVVCVIKLAQGIGADMLWMSHVALGLAGIGLLLQSPRLVATALICVLVPHLLWLIDWVTWRLDGTHPLGVSAYLDDADAFTWTATLHHFYLVPVLAFAIAQTRVRLPAACAAAIALFLVLTLAGRFGLPPERNVNSAFSALPLVESDEIRWINAQPAAVYLTGLNAFAIVAFVLPAGALLALTGTGRRKAVEACGWPTCLVSGMCPCRGSDAYADHDEDDELITLSVDGGEDPDVEVRPAACAA